MEITRKQAKYQFKDAVAFLDEDSDGLKPTDCTFTVSEGHLYVTISLRSESPIAGRTLKWTDDATGMFWEIVQNDRE